MSNVVRWIAPDLMAAPETEPETEELQADEAWLGDDSEPEPEPALKPPTLEEIEAIQNAAQQEGFERGHADGYAQGQAEVRRLIAQIEGILDNFSRPLVRLENEVVGALGDYATYFADDSFKPLEH